MIPCSQTTKQNSVDVPPLSLEIPVPVPYPPALPSVVIVIGAVYNPQRTPLHSKAAPFVPQAPTCQLGATYYEAGAACYDEASDDESTTAETAGYLTE